jgi:hypothetical protein
VLYRDLIRSGVSEYIVLPDTAQSIVNAISEIFASENAKPIGRTIGFVAAKGGAGSSTFAHNVAWSISQSLRQDCLVMDFDLAFGTAGLNFNQDPPHGLADAVLANQKVDQVMLDRLMSKAANHINLLTAPVTLDRTYDFEEREFEQIVEMCQSSVPVIVLDIPHAWTAWVRHTIATVDEIVVAADGELTVEASFALSGGAWGTFDDVVLERVGSLEPEWPAWDPRQVYVVGDRVTHDGGGYEARRRNRGKEPGNPRGPWQEIASADDGTVLGTPSPVGPWEAVQGSS